MAEHITPDESLKRERNISIFLESYYHKTIKEANIINSPDRALEHIEMKLKDFNENRKSILVDIGRYKLWGGHPYDNEFWDVAKELEREIELRKKMVEKKFEKKDYSMFNYNHDRIIRYAHSMNDSNNKIFYLLWVEAKAKNKQDLELVRLINEEIEYINKLDAFKQSRVPQNSNYVKIRWNGSEGQLIYLIESLIANNFLNIDNLFSFIEEHFLTKTGKPFKSPQLRQAKYQYEISHSKKPKRSEIIDQKVSESKEQN